MESFNQNVIRHKTGLLNLAAELGNIGLPRYGRVPGTFYRYQAAREAGGIEALFDVNRRKPNLKNRVDEVTEEAVVRLATDYPAYGQIHASNELRKGGIVVSPSGVRSIWLRHGLETFKQRLAVLEKKSAEEGIVLTEAQVQALERKQQDDEACGEIESPHPGYLGSQDSLYVGILGVWDASTSKHSWTRTASGRWPGCTPPERPSRQRNCSMIAFYPSSPHRRWESSEC